MAQRTPKKKSLRAASLFCGAGGLDVGFARAGFDIVYAVDNDADSCETYRQGIGAHADLKDVSELTGLPPHDVLIGGPPCQGFSVAGNMDPDDPRSGMIWEFARLVGLSRPAVFVMENVKALAAVSRWKPVRDSLEAKFGGLGYSVAVHVLNAKDFGVPQSRERAFFVGVRGGMPMPPPRPTGSFSPTARAVLSAFPPPGAPPNSAPCRAKITPAKKPIMRKSPFAGMLFNGQGRPIDLDSTVNTLPASMGGNRTPIVDERALRKGAKQWIVGHHARLASEKCPPVTKAPSFLRRITVAEAAAIQGFPPGFEFCGSQSSQYRQIGNAVPPPLAHAVAESVAAWLESRDPSRLAFCEDSAQVPGLVV